MVVDTAWLTSQAALNFCKEILTGQGPRQLTPAVWPELTAIHQPIEDMARAAVTAALQRRAACVLTGS